MKKSIISLVVLMSVVIWMASCNDAKKESTAETSSAKQNFGGFETKEKWGEHLVMICSCHDCHTPKKMTPQGPEPDFELALSGHPANAPIPDINRKDVQKKGLVVSNDLTSWAGPWGVSFTANLTSDSTGIGAWKEEQFMNAIRHGKFKGLDGARSLLPPMPWPMYKSMTDDELKAVFAYLKSTKPIKNVVPEPLPPMQ